ncbi:alpha-L-fucosidase 1 [Sarocladium strictum]
MMAHLFALFGRLAYGLTPGMLVNSRQALHDTTPPEPYLQIPEPRQLAWHQTEFYGFAHFGPNTFTGEEWGRSQPFPDVFDPTRLDTDQWAKAFVDAGMGGLILTTKHHDGMCLWNTSTTPYKIENSRWAESRRSQGLDTNIVAMAAQSCKKHGLKFGVYLSPWDINRDPAMPKPHLQGTEYDVPQIFGDDSEGDYNEFYSQQLLELVDMALEDGSKIDLFEVWLDGASGSDTKQTFDFTRFRSIIREHQPNAVMWGHQGPDARWAGNEEGYTGEMNWHTINSTPDDERLSEAALELGARDGKYWTPAEANARIRDGWFWHEEEEPKSSEALLEMYMKSQGRSVNLLLNVGPDDTGRIPEKDSRALLEFQEARNNFLGRELVTSKSHVTASAIRGNDHEQFGPANAIDGQADTYWTMDDDQTTGWLEVNLGRHAKIEGFIVQEHIALGQRIGGYAWDVLVEDEWVEVATGVTMGYKRIDRLDSPVSASRARLRITQANAVPLVRRVQILGSSCKRRSNA